jgi:UDPglucose 6-dehydrogenase
VLEGVGLDHRLGPHFLRAGAGFGGSCFPKDLHALVAFSETIDLPALMPIAALDQNEIQPFRVIDMVRRAIGPDIRGKRVTLLGLAFKPETDDVRETRALPIYYALVELGAEVICHDPQAAGGFRELVEEAGLVQPEIVEGLEDALRGAEVAILHTEWSEYRSLEPEQWVSLMADPPVVIDGRRALDPARMVAAGIQYHGIGWPSPD